MKKVINGVDYMSERFELSFKNKEVRMWFYWAVPMFIIGSIIIFYGEQKYQRYVPLLMIVITWTIFYLWRFFYRRKQKKEEKNSS
ncbi:hypothetical protein [Psychrobacillus vulpis]|uniref:Uncharacterized protein n=1 Tax=Psychrobacillus vulpis TaxID=2325572 RepID=A0A544TBE4_9BACI|nr:hypothetical protein [Psychrobacillus vulpis]TQR14771.1 hypothetical protein FG384_19470 [Psychrobacillus vulpis]